MISRGPLQPLPFCDSAISCVADASRTLGVCQEFRFGSDCLPFQVHPTSRFCKAAKPSQQAKLGSFYDISFRSANMIVSLIKKWSKGTCFMVFSIFNLPTQHKLQQNISLSLSTVYATATSAGLSTASLRTPSHSYLGPCQSIKRFKERHKFHFLN